MADLEAAPTIEPNTRFKYSNHGFGLIGLAMEAVTGERFDVLAPARDHRCRRARGDASRHADPQVGADGERP